MTEYSILYTFASAICCLYNESYTPWFSEGTSCKTKEEDSLIRVSIINITASILLGDLERALATIRTKMVNSALRCAATGTAYALNRPNSSPCATRMRQTPKYSTVRPSPPEMAHTRSNNLRQQRLLYKYVDTAWPGWRVCTLQF